MSEQITGRDDFIINQALAYAIVAIESLPRERQESSNREDMRALLRARLGEEQADRLLGLVRRQMGVQGGSDVH